jgi:hypothetical protein
VKRYSIDSQLGSLPQGVLKKYVMLYHQAGFELGFGRSGVYRGHSHLFFVDVLFSPGGIQFVDINQTEPIRLVIVPPRTSFPHVETCDFAFLKFCPDRQIVELPDKVDSGHSDFSMSAYFERAHVISPWHPYPGSEPKRVDIRLCGSRLRIKATDCPSILISE